MPRTRGVGQQTPALRRGLGDRGHSLKDWAAVLAEKGRALVQSAKDRGIPLGHINRTREKTRI